MQFLRRRVRGVAVCAAVGVLALSGPRTSWSQASTPSAEISRDSAEISKPPRIEHPSLSAQLFASKEDAQSSELRHHLAGWSLVLAGLFLIAEPTLRKRWPSSRYAWPLVFLAAGLFLLVFSDEELWPLGPVNWFYGVTHNSEDLQHKIFGAILLVLGAIEIQRARGILTSAWAALTFPVLALVGSLMLLLHRHELGMTDANDDMALMRHVQAQHVKFAIAGGGIAVAKGLSELRTQWQGIFLRVWPVLLIVLGVLLIRYTQA